MYIYFEDKEMLFFNSMKTVFHKRYPIERKNNSLCLKIILTYKKSFYNVVK